ncbi:MAG: glycosyltransferase family 2 protein [Clostridiaceae bacterium]|nr:glycosyltransferase family 2 protein [Clostridiaceae bacterium]
MGEITKNTLFIVMPAYNEEANIRAVARQWHEIALKYGNHSRLIIFNDGSKDNTWTILTELEDELPRLTAINKENSGHGATLRTAYEYALGNGADYIFQTDSDGQTLTDDFPFFWENRDHYSAIIGHRKNRQDGFSRIVVTKVLRAVLLLIFHVNIPDANTPFRIMKRITLQTYLSRVPDGFNLTNVLLSVLMASAGENVLFVPISFRPRQGGVNSINLRRIMGIGRQAVRDFLAIRKELKRTK